jgi:zinc-binding alcohol dehydrogenase/oxidoreductase
MNSTTTSTSTMKAVVIDPQIERQLTIEQLSIPVAGPGEVVVKLKTAALNHRDFLAYRGWPAAREWGPFVIGSDGAGLVHVVGEGVTTWQVGDEVIINNRIGCGECRDCLRGADNFCKHVNIVLGGPDGGTFAEYVKIPARNLLPKPAHLSFAEAGSLAMALGTAWRILVSRGQVSAEHNVLIQGIGGGVAQFSLQIAVAMGARVFVTSSSDEKIQRAIEMGAVGGINYRTEDVEARAWELTDGDGFDLILDNGGQSSLPTSFKIVRMGGNVLTVGSVTGPTELKTMELGRRMSGLITSSMYSAPELKAAVEFYNAHQLHPTISDTLPLEEVEKGLVQLENSVQFGKIVLTIE